MTNEVKTNNDPSLLESKIQLRLQSLPDKKEIKVLEAFGGEGVLWKNVMKRTDKKILILSIDKNKYRRVQLQGDNLKFLHSMNLSEFDIIDLDAWGSPVKQLQVLFEKKYSGIVHCTMIQTMTGNLDKSLLLANGFTEAMLKKCQVLFTKDALKLFFNYLALNGIKKAWYVSKNRKNYLWFHITSA